MNPAVSALILAGGQGSRMGGRDKGLVHYQNRALVDIAIERIAPQASELLISANRNIEDYAARGYPVLVDSLDGFQGPLAGVMEGLKAARHDWLLSVPCDMPNLPDDLCVRLMQARTDKAIIIAVDTERSHPAVMLIHRRLATALSDYVFSGQRAVHKFQAQMAATGMRWHLVLLFLGNVMLLVGLVIVTLESTGATQKVALVILLVAMFSALSGVTLNFLTLGSLGGDEARQSQAIEQLLKESKGSWQP